MGLVNQVLQADPVDKGKRLSVIHCPGLQQVRKENIRNNSQKLTFQGNNIKDIQTGFYMLQLKIKFR